MSRRGQFQLPFKRNSFLSLLIVVYVGPHVLLAEVLQGRLKPSNSLLFARHLGLFSQSLDNSCFPSWSQAHPEEHPVRELYAQCLDRARSGPYAAISPEASALM